MSRFLLLVALQLLATAELSLAQSGKAQATTPAATPAARALQVGVGSYHRSQFDSATVAFAQALRLARTGSPPDTALQLQAYTNLGNVAADQGHNPQALAWYQQGQRLAEASHNRHGTAKLGSNIGTLFQNWGRFAEALSYFDQAEREARALADTALLADCYNNKGTVYEQLKRYSRARSYYQQALHMYEQGHQPSHVAMALSNLAIVQKRLNDYPASIASTRRALGIARQMGDQWQEAAMLNNLGSTLTENGQPAAAEPLLREGLGLARRIKARELVMAVLESMSEAAAKSGRFQQAYDFHRDFSVQKDSFVNAESHRQLSELQVRYDTQKKQRENEQLRYENRLRTLAQQGAERRRRRTQFLAIGSILVLLLLGGGGYYYQHLRRRHREQRNLTQALFDGEQTERIRLARDLHDGVGQYLAVVRMYVSELVEGGPDATAQAAHTLELVDQTIQEVRTVSHNLIPNELNFGFCRALRELSRQVNQAGTLQLRLDLADDLPELARELEVPLYRVVQEVVNGMIRHAEASEIIIRYFRQNQQLVVQLIDNGKGFDTQQLTESKGLGWKNIQARVGLMNGQLRVQSRQARGTRVRIAVPEA